MGQRRRDRHFAKKLIKGKIGQKFNMEDVDKWTRHRQIIEQVICGYLRNYCVDDKRNPKRIYGFCHFAKPEIFSGTGLGICKSQFPMPQTCYYKNNYFRQKRKRKVANVRGFNENGSLDAYILWREKAVAVSLKLNDKGFIERVKVKGWLRDYWRDRDSGEMVEKIEQLPPNLRPKLKKYLIGLGPGLAREMKDILPEGVDSAYENPRGLARKIAM